MDAPCCSNKRSKLIACLAGVRFRLGFIGEYSDLAFLNHENARSASGHRVEKNLSVVENTCLANLGNISTANKEIHLRLVLNSAARRKAEEFLRQHRLEKAFLIGIHPGCGLGYDIPKRWSEDKFAALGNRLGEEFPNVALIIFAGPDEREIGQRISQKIVNGKAVLAAGLTILETAALIERLRLLVCNDSGLMHIASSLDTPTVAIFGPTDPAEVGPWGNIHRVIWAAENLACRNCYYGDRYLVSCKGKVSCLDELGTEEVFRVVEEKIKTIIAQKRQRAERGTGLCIPDRH
jgi:ADP-heptose:LPS heptosyltransferase